MIPDPQVAALPLFELADFVRQIQGEALDLFGFGPDECAYRVVASTPCWRLRNYGGPGAGQPLLMVAAPIKRPYIWDFAPSMSPIRFLLRRGLRVYLLEWTPPRSDKEAHGLDIYADRGLSACVARIAAEDGKAPVLIGHSLGGTFAAIYAALDSCRVRGLVLVGAPVCFQPQSSTFRDAVDRLAPLLLMQSAIVPGSAISYLSALASPDTFIRSRLLDGVLSSVDRHAAGICIRVERWTLDEVALSGPMVRQVTQWLYREDRLCRGTLQLRNRSIGPSTAQVATLAVVNTADKIAPRAAVEPFLARMPERDVQLLEFAGEPGVGLQHVALLVGPRARVEVWPAIGAWIEAHSC